MTEIFCRRQSCRYNTKEGTKRCLRNHIVILKDGVCAHYMVEEKDGESSDNDHP